MENTLIQKTIDYMDSQCVKHAKSLERALAKTNVKQDEIDGIREKLSYYDYAIAVMKRMKEYDCEI